MDQRVRALRERLGLYGELKENRDQLIKDAWLAGISKTDIHRLTGLGRNTIDRICGTEADRAGLTSPPPGP